MKTVWYDTIFGVFMATEKLTSVKISFTLLFTLVKINVYLWDTILIIHLVGQSLSSVALWQTFKTLKSKIIMEKSQTIMLYKEKLDKIIEAIQDKRKFYNSNVYAANIWCNIAGSANKQFCFLFKTKPKHSYKCLSWWPNMRLYCHFILFPLQTSLCLNSTVTFCPGQHWHSPKGEPAI